MVHSGLSVRYHILNILEQVLDHQAFASEQIDRCLQKAKLTPKDRGLLTQSVYGILREKGFLDQQLQPLLKKTTAPLLWHGLRFGLYQILFLDRVPDHAALFETVEWAKSKGGKPWAGLVNAVLRRLLKSREGIVLERQKPEGEQRTLPPWLWRRWQKRHGATKALGLLREFNRVPPIYMRLNPLKAKGELIQEKLQEASIHWEALEQGSLLKISPGFGEGLRPFLQAGWGSLQDGHSFQITKLLDPQVGERGLDLCAGHGGKTSAIAEELGRSGSVPTALFASDIQSAQLKELELNFKRLGLRFPIINPINQALKQGSWDWVLVDAPCTGLGTLGRKPEIRWRTDPRSPAQMAKSQLEILESVAPSVKVGGRILYSVCSLEPEEGLGVLEAFLQRQPRWTLAAHGELWPGAAGSDGFFWGRLIRKS